MFRCDIINTFSRYYTFLSLYSEILYKLRMLWVQNACSGEYLWPLGEGKEGLLLEQLSNGGSPSLLQVIPKVSCDTWGRAFALLFRVFPWVICKEGFKQLIRYWETVMIWTIRTPNPSFQKISPFCAYLKLNINSHAISRRTLSVKP